jgi:two-component system, LytTR family, response regulator
MTTVRWRNASWALTPDSVAPVRSTGPLRMVTLGDFVVLRDGAPVELGQHQARDLLAILICTHGPVHRDKVIEWLWPHLSEERALSTLYSTVYTLRQRLEPGRTHSAALSFVRSDGEAYRLDWQRDDYLDVGEFMRLAQLALRPLSAETRLELLQAAEAAYTGPFLPQWPYADWASTSRTEVEETYQAVASELAGLYADVSRTTAAVALYRRLLVLDPERETWHRALMEIFIAEGDRSLAAHQYRLCQRILQERLGIEPSPKTQKLFASLADS